MTEQNHKESRTRDVHAAALIVGNEILSGRTQDKNIFFIAETLHAHGIVLSEVRIVEDDEAAITEAVTILRFRYDYVLMTGGIGPTHDDRTSVAVARAFCCPLVCDEEALARLRHHYGERLNESRKKMAYVPKGSVLIDNPISHAPGYRMGNVLVMAGVPLIMQAMLRGVVGSLRGGRVMHSTSLACACAEGDIAPILDDHQKRHHDIDIGSYPWFTSKDLGVNVVLRGYDSKGLVHVTQSLQKALTEQGYDVKQYKRGDST
ncbi:MAG: competence/damage-inducible protein A [Alphaproteobacteria bacterium GM202ARS2]|nr:competence/damage-inducible protein A [Alphaproteobacteria bacterium GM202ARS2]